MNTRSLFFLVITLACGGESPAGPPPNGGGNPSTPATISSVRLGTAPDTLRSFGDTARLSVTVRMSDSTTATNVPLTWTSRNVPVAIVFDGLVTGLANGTTTVVVEAPGGFKDSLAVSIRQRAARLVIGPVATGEMGIALAAVNASARDNRGYLVASFQDSIDISLTPDGRGTLLAGKVRRAAVAGVAVFDSVVVPRGGQFTIVASSGALAPATSGTFDVLLRFTSISPGMLFTSCGISVDGEGYCWGRNQAGGLGIGTAGADRAYPALLAGGLQFTAIIGGSGSNEGGNFDGSGCGIRDNGVSYCWGRNLFGQLGNAAAGNYSTTPIAVAGGITFVQLTSGRDHTCGLTGLGAAYCWGRNNAGQIGDGTLTNRPEPVAVAGGLSFTQIQSGNYLTCGITPSMDGYCWGGSGPSHLPGSVVWTPQLIAGGLQFKRIVPGLFEHICAITISDDAYCWGQNFHGELGAGDLTADSGTPLLVLGGFKYKAVAPGAQYSCGLTTAGDVYCWGWNAGNGTYSINATSNDSATPVKLATTVTFEKLLAGSQTMCGLTAGNAAYCWGFSQFGEVGVGVGGLIPLPVRVQAPR